MDYNIPSDSPFYGRLDRKFLVGFTASLNRKKQKFAVHENENRLKTFRICFKKFFNFPQAKICDVSGC